MAGAGCRPRKEEGMVRTGEKQILSGEGQKKGPSTIRTGAWFLAEHKVQ